MSKSRTFQKYGNGDHQTGVLAYDYDKNSITVLFKDAYYLYDDEKPGIKHVEIMIELAKKGAGLSAYISQNVKHNYKDRWER